MRRMAMACEHIHWVVRGDLFVEDESFEEDEDIESNDKSNSD